MTRTIARNRAPLHREAPLLVISILRHALEAPKRQIAQNSGFDGGVVVDRMRSGEGTRGFDASAGQYVDLVELRPRRKSGIDPGFPRPKRPEGDTSINRDRAERDRFLLESSPAVAIFSTEVDTRAAWVSCRGRRGTRVAAN